MHEHACMPRPAAGHLTAQATRTPVQHSMQHAYSRAGHIQLLQQVWPPRRGPRRTTWQQCSGTYTGLKTILHTLGFPVCCNAGMHDRLEAHVASRYMQAPGYGTVTPCSCLEFGYAGTHWGALEYLGVCAHTHLQSPTGLRF